MRILRLYWRGWFGRNSLVGEANYVSQDGGEILLGNWFIEPRYRRSGLGSALLKEAIRLAREQGGHLLFGNISQDDLQASPHLLQLYQAHGFQVRGPREQQWVASVELTL